MSSKNDPYTRDEDTRFTMRVDTELLNRIKAQAKQNKRSTAKEIELILEKYFENTDKR